jgi:ATP adenylyltransferase
MRMSIDFKRLHGPECGVSIAHMVTSTCALCSSLGSNRGNEPWDTVLWEDQSFVAMPTRGALLPGWTLVVSKEHYLCAGSLDSEGRRALFEFVETTRRRVENAFGPCTTFEHGPAVRNTSVGCGVDHLHIHVVPLPFSLTEATSSVAPVTWKILDQEEALGQLHSEALSYSFVSEPGQTTKIAAPSPAIRQLFRRAIAKRLGVPNQFDYQSFPHVAAVIQTLTTLLQNSRAA